MREASILVGTHPETLPGYPQKILVEHPTVDPLIQGAPDLGWEGDTRLAIYLDVPAQRFEVWRLEADGKYRMFARLGEGTTLTPEHMNRLIQRLISHDKQRGFDAGRHVEQKVAEDDAAHNAEMASFLGEHLYPKLRWALEKDGWL